jgi:DNA-directed RNA polymerase specialized sigma24 family protein
MCQIRYHAAPGLMSDIELQQLVMEIQASTDRKTPIVRKQIDRLLRGISSRLEVAKRALVVKWSSIVDIECLVAEAVNNTLMEALKNIDRYNPAHRVMPWIQGILNFRFKDVLKKYRIPYESTSFDNPNALVEAQVAQMSAMQPEHTENNLRNFIEEDREGHFAGTCIKGHPHATFQRILLMQLDGLKWREIASKLNIDSISTVNSFYSKQFDKFNAYFREHLSE